MKYTNAQIQCVCDIGLHSAHVRGFKLCGPICKLEIDRAVSAPPAAAGQKAHKARFSKHKTPDFFMSNETICAQHISCVSFLLQQTVWKKRKCTLTERRNLIYYTSECLQFLNTTQCNAQWLEDWCIFAEGGKDITEGLVDWLALHLNNGLIDLLHNSALS